MYNILWRPRGGYPNPTLGRYIIWGLGWLSEGDDDQAELGVNWVEGKEKAFQETETE